MSMIKKVYMLGYPLPVCSISTKGKGAASRLTLVFRKPVPKWLKCGRQRKDELLPKTLTKPLLAHETTLKYFLNLKLC